MQFQLVELISSVVMMNKNKKKTVLITIMYAALFLFGYTVFEFERTEFSEEASFLSKYSGMISNLLLALGCFYEIYFEKPKSSNE
jgi:hypothetical protein